MAHTTAAFVKECRAVVAARLDTLCGGGGSGVGNDIYPRRPVAEVSLGTDVEIQTRLGSGAFSVVFEAIVSTKLKLPELVAEDTIDTDTMTNTNNTKNDSNNNYNEDNTTVCCGSTYSSSHPSAWSFSDSSSFRTTATTAKTNTETAAPSSFALKRIRADMLANKTARDIAVKDFLLEVELLSRLPVHPNIIRLVALSPGFFDLNEHDDNGISFCILEKLEETLEQRLARWEQQHQATTPTHRSLKGLLGGGGCIFFNAKHEKEEEEQQRQRLLAYAIPTAKAMQHLHRHNILFRDLKPANIGITSDSPTSNTTTPRGRIQNKVRLFDFGLARSYHPREKEGYLLTGNVGTLRYMAPEIALCLPRYDFRADIYSFGMVLWQIACLQRPLGHLNQRGEFYQAVITNQIRPSLKPILNKPVATLIQDCWQPQPYQRPDSFAAVLHQLDAALQPQPLQVSVQQQGRNSIRTKTCATATPTTVSRSPMKQKQASFGASYSFPAPSEKKGSRRFGFFKKSPLSSSSFKHQLH